VQTVSLVFKTFYLGAKLVSPWVKILVWYKGHRDQSSEWRQPKPLKFTFSVNFISLLRKILPGNFSLLLGQLVHFSLSVLHRNVNFQYVDFQYVNLQLTLGWLPICWLTVCRLPICQLTICRLTICQLTTYSRLTSNTFVDLQYVYFQYVNFQYVDFQYVNFQYVYFQ
jgi:uncharacterized protein YjbI with pentapeptide repeats